MRSGNREHFMHEPVLKVLRIAELRAWTREELADAIVQALREHLALSDDEGPGFGPEPRQDSATAALSKELLEGAIIPKLKRRKRKDLLVNVTLVVTAPGDKIAIASTEPDPVWILEALKMGWMAARRQIRRSG